MKIVGTPDEIADFFKEVQGQQSKREVKILLKGKDIANVSLFPNKAHLAELKGYEPQETTEMISEEIKGDKPQIKLSATYPPNDMCSKTSIN